MANVVKIKKGLDINLKGKAPSEFLNDCQSESYAVVPDHYTGITPKVVVRTGDHVKAGTPVMIDKTYPEIKIVAPVSGEVTGINRGEKRKILSITIKSDAQMEYEKFDIQDVATSDAETLKALLLEAGFWPFIKQRPYDRIANPSETPRDIFVTAHFSAPLAPEFEFVVKDEKEELRTGLEVLTKLTSGKVYVGVKGGSSLRDLSGVEVVELYGPHPVGNVGVMINHIKPINKGETVWTLNAADVVLIGRLFKNGKVDFKRTIILSGSGISGRGYIKVIAGCRLGEIGRVGIAGKNKHLRIICGDVLTGTCVTADDYLSPFCNQITVIPEGDDVDEFIGWAMPGLGKYSVSRTYFTWLMGKNKAYDLDARIKGGKRAMIMSNEYDKVFPMDILPEYLLKAIIAFDIEKMENLGIYEVAPEDFALCEFVDTSKIEIQKIVRNGLDLLYKEMN